MQSAAVWIFVAAAVALHAQPATDVEALVDRMARYLAEYEHQLSTVIADERFRAMAGGGRFQGRATCSNFRRFTTSARIIPPP